MTGECTGFLGDIPIGGEDSDGVRWSGLISGWDGSPGSTGDAVQRSWAHGTWFRTPFLKARNPRLQGRIAAPSHDALHRAIDRLNATVTLTPFMLRVLELGGLDRIATVRRDGEVLAATRSERGAAYDVSLVADDPFKYAYTPTVIGPLSPPTWTGGLTVPFNVPFFIDSTQVGGTGAAMNAGNATTALTLRFDGPLTDPSVTVQDAAGDIHTLRIDLTIPTGQWLDVQTGERSVLLNGTASYRGAATADPDWPLLPPGANTIEFRAATGNGTLTATYRSAWW